MLPRENLYFPDLNVCILRCFKAHKVDNNIGLKPSQRAVEAYIIFQDNRFLNMRIRLNVAMNDPCYKLQIENI